MKQVKRVLIALLGLFAIKTVIQAGKERRVEKAREYYQRTGDLEKTMKIYNVKKEDIQ